MAWRIVKQPNGKYARFADPVDNFTHYNMTREEAVKYCQDEMGLVEGEEKVHRADENPGRFNEELGTVQAIHGIEERRKIELLLSGTNPKLVREIVFLPAFDKRHPDPAQSRGVHGAEMRWYLKGALGIIQFVVFTNWMLPGTWKEQDGYPVIKESPHLLCRPMAVDLGYHSPFPLYDGQEPMPHCAFFNPCFYDGSILRAEAVLATLIAQGGEAVWAILEAEYQDRFCPEADQSKEVRNV